MVARSDDARGSARERAQDELLTELVGALRKARELQSDWHHERADRRKRPVHEAVVLIVRNLRAALFPFGRGPRRTEFYELSLAPGGVEHAAAHPPGTTENLVVSSGRLEIRVHGKEHLLETGDAILFRADVEHSYKNIGDTPTLMYLVMTYAADVE